MDGQAFRQIRESLKRSQGELRLILNTRLGRAYDKSRLSRWENDREAIPADVAIEMNNLHSQRTVHGKIIALANQKGGVGKTTSALNLTIAFSRLGYRTLLVDMDPQASATDWILSADGLAVHRSGRSCPHVILRGASISECILRADEEYSGKGRPFDFLTSHIDLAEADGRREPGFEHCLRENLDLVASNYDYIVIDAPPNLGLLTYMALVAADTVIIPVQTEPPDAMGVALLIQTIQKIQRRLNPSLRITGILPTRYNARQSVDREVLHSLIRSTAGVAAVLEPVAESSIFGNAAWSGAIALDASPKAKAVGIYMRIANAIALNTPLPLALLDLDAETVEPNIDQKRGSK
jgi:chromosome partitioning protein